MTALSMSVMCCAFEPSLRMDASESGVIESSVGNVRW
jgi:hypothetical protein